VDNFIKYHLIIGPLFLALAIVLKIFTPKKINPLYGFRTPRSMKNQEAWDFANKFSATWMLYLTISLIPIQVISYLSIGGKSAIQISAGYFVFGLIVLIVITEIKLKQKDF